MRIQRKKMEAAKSYSSSEGDTPTWTHVLCTNRLLISPAMCTTSRQIFPRSHPGPGPPHFASLGSTSALQQIEVEYFGHGFVLEAFLKNCDVKVDP